MITITFGFSGLPSLTSEIYCECVIQWKLHSQWFLNLYFVSDKIIYFINFQTWNSIWGLLTFPTPCRSFNYLPLFLLSSSCHITQWLHISLPSEPHHHPAPLSLFKIWFQYYLLREALCALFLTEKWFPSIEDQSPNTKYTEQRIQRKFSDF